VNLLERLDITPQPKHRADVLSVLDEVKHSPFIGEISPEEIEQLCHAQTILFFYDGDVLAGLVGWNMIHKTWIEVGPIYTVRAYRGQGLGGFMFDTVEEMQLQAGHKLYGVTKNPVVKGMFEKRGFRRVSLWALPYEVQRYLLRKLTLRKLLHHARKLRFRDSVSHFIKSGEAK
jgi:GNAT superfamily N-acetyltransferase